jgi:hypothetical protein
MDGSGYWVNISRAGTRLGAGFLLTGTYVLTAHHCLESAVPGGEDVEVEFESGEVLPGRVHRRSPGADLALIDLPTHGKGPVIPRPDRANVGDEWRNPYRPSLGHALLTGMIRAVPVSYQCAAGEIIEAMQLECIEDLGDYAGYSGSPIEGGGPDGEIKLFGVLIEQYPDHYPANTASRPASRVLFAVTLSEVMRRFDCFDMGRLAHLLPSSSGGHVPVPGAGDGKPPVGRSGQNDVESHIAVADAKIEALHAWQKRGLLSEERITALKVRVIERYLLSDDQGEQP